jgi:hypothetical protein
VPDLKEKSETRTPAPGNLPADARCAYEAVARDPKYQHFVHIPDRILQCLDYFGVACDREVARTRLHSYYLFIGVVDDAIDSGMMDSGGFILERLSKPSPRFDEETNRSRVKLVTEVLKCDVDNETHPLMMTRLRELYAEVVNERTATSIESYLNHRKSVGSLTAELSYLLIRPFLFGDHEPLCRLMKQVGAIGCLVDSLIDLSADRRLGLLGFKPGVRDYAQLITCILRDGLRVSLKHPGLFRLFLQAIVDNVQDRFRGERNFPHHSFVSDRKDEVARVA